MEAYRNQSSHESHIKAIEVLSSVTVDIENKRKVKIEAFQIESIYNKYQKGEVSQVSEDEILEDLRILFAAHGSDNSESRKQNEDVKELLAQQKGEEYFQAFFKLVEEETEKIKEEQEKAKKVEKEQKNKKTKAQSNFSSN